MPRLKRLRSFLPQLSIILILLCLLVIASLMHSWFIRSAEAELLAARQNLNNLILQTIGREFQRYGMLIGEFESAIQGKALSVGEARAYLERTLNTWGPSGAIPHLISDVAIIEGFDQGDPHWVGSAPDTSGRSWQTMPDLTFNLPRNSLTRLANHELVLNIPGLANGYGDYLLLGRAGRNSNRLLAITINGQRFYDNWILPALSANLPQANIRITKSQRTGPAAPRDFPRSPQFSPLAALWGKNSRLGRSLDFPLPIFSDFYRGSPGAEPGHKMPGSRTPQRRFMFSHWDERPHNGQRWGVLSVAFEPGSSLDNMEFRLALNWLLGMAMLAGVGVAFILLVLQTIRLRETRQQEREFVAAITHELRTPLTVIQSCADNLARGIISLERLKTYGEMIREQSHRLGQMIEGVLSFAQVEGRPESRPELVDCDPRELVAKLQASLDTVAAGRGLQIEWHCELLPAQCRSDPDRLRLILENLVVNALIHAYPPGQSGSIRVHGAIQGADQLVFSIEDDGRGIPSFEAKRVFQAFFRGKSSRQNQESGAGLGLHLAKANARLLEAWLRLESPYRRSDGKSHSGCRFRLILPYVPGESAHE